MSRLVEVIRAFSSTGLATAVHSNLFRMDEILDWRSIERRLEKMGRGARSRLAEQLRMDRSQLARTLRTKAYPRTDQEKIIQQFLAGEPVDGVKDDGAPWTHDQPMRVPIYGFASAGDHIAFNDGAILDWIDLPRGMSLKGEFFVVQTFGSSMEPRIWAGERKLVQRNVPPARGQDAVIEFSNGTAVLKTYTGQKDGVVFARQYNPDTELRYSGTDVKAIHATFPL